MLWEDIKFLFTIFLACPEDVCIERIKKEAEEKLMINVNSISKKSKSLKEETIPSVDNLKGYGHVFEIKGDEIRQLTKFLMILAKNKIFT